MKVKKNRLALTFVTTVSACLIVASANAQTQTIRSPGSNFPSQSQSATTRPYTSYYAPPPPIKQPQVTSPITVVYAGPVLSMALPSAGPYQGGLKIGRRREFAVQPVSFTTPPPPSTSNPFPTMNEQVSRMSENVLQPPTSYLGDSARATGQGAARLAVRRAMYGNIGMSGY